MRQIFADYLKLTDNPKRFVNLSVTQMMNYYKIHGHIDRIHVQRGGREREHGREPVRYLP